MRGTQVGQYELLEQIGVGGMGQVWRARHVILDRPFAVKLIRPDVHGAERQILFERLLREAKVTAKLKSFHSVDVTDFDITDDGAFFMVMELLDGVDLEQLVAANGPVPVARVVETLRMVCESLEEAHRTMVHRDIKPSNIMLCRHGLKLDVAKVLDFGIVKPISDAHLLTGAGLTADQRILGTPAFMAPEATHSDASIDGRADLYSLGSVAFTLLTGRLVFDQRHPLDMLLAHRSETPKPPSAFAEQPIPAELDAIVLRCLEKDPDDRFATAGELAAALAEVPIETPWTDADTAAWWVEHHPEPRVQPTPVKVDRRKSAQTMPFESVPGAGGAGAAAPPAKTPTESTPRFVVELTIVLGIGGIVGVVLLVGWLAGALNPGAAVDSARVAGADTVRDAVAVVPVDDPVAHTQDTEPTGATDETEDTDGTDEVVVPPPPGPQPDSVLEAEDTEDTEPPPPPPTGDCALVGDPGGVRVFLREAGSTQPPDRPCGAGVPVGRYEVHADFGAGLKQVRVIEVTEDEPIRLECNPVRHTCDPP